MPVSATTHAVERSTFVVHATFTDEDGAAVTPDALAWSLEDPAGNTINGRSNVSKAPAAAIDIVLAGDDLQLLDQTNESEIRRLILTGTYLSSLGANMPLADSLEFRVLNTNALRPA
jgi:hypothetical protein